MRTFLHTLVIGGLLLIPAGWVSAETIFDLADAVGGGDGSLPGTGGSGSLDATVGSYKTFAENAFVDGTFVPNHSTEYALDYPGQTLPAAVIDGAGHTYDFDAQTAGSTQTTGPRLVYYNSWVNGSNFDVNPVDTNYTPDFLGDPNNHSLLAGHANKGITFDLQAVRDATGLTPINFTTWAGDSRPKSNAGTICYYVFVDGVLKANRNNIKDDEDYLEIALSETDRYLTLAISDANDGIGADHGYFGDPFLHMVPEPSSAVLLALGVVMLPWIGCRMRRRGA